LEGWDEDRSLRHAAGVSVGKRREEAEWGDNAYEEKRQNRNPIRGVTGMGVRDQQQNKRNSDRDGRNQKNPTPLLDRFHR